jgi:flotillin
VVVTIRIESFKICDVGLADFISKQAVVTAQTQSNLANLQGETEIATATQERDATVQKIAAEAKARVLEMNTQAENTANISKAEAAAKAKQIQTETEATAQSNALLAKAKAEAEAVKIKAEAEAHAIRAVSDAEYKRAELLAKTTIGSQLALLDTSARLLFLY